MKTNSLNSFKKDFEELLRKRKATPYRLSQLLTGVGGSVGGRSSVGRGRIASLRRGNIQLDSLLELLDVLEADIKIVPR